VGQSTYHSLRATPRLEFDSFFFGSLPGEMRLAFRDGQNAICLESKGKRADSSPIAGLIKYADSPATATFGHRFSGAEKSSGLFSVI